MSESSCSVQTAGLSTAENEALMTAGGGHHEHEESNYSSSSGGQRGDVSAPSPNINLPRGVVEVEARPPPLAPSPSSSFRKGLSLKLFKRGQSKPDQLSYSSQSISHRTMALSQTISTSAPTVLRSAMSTRTLDDSLGKTMAARAPRETGRAVAFGQVNVRQYERILGDNPSVSSGVPLGIGWRHSPDTSVDVDEYENKKPAPRDRTEFLVPKPVREGLVQEHANVRRREIVSAVREIQKTKAQRRRTVNNLEYQKTQERVEGAKRKMKKILRPSQSSGALQAQLWDKAHAAAREKALRLEDSVRRGESVSMRNVYSVGNPCNNIVPSRRNSSPAEGSDAIKVWQPRRCSHPVLSDLEKEGESEQVTPTTSTPGGPDAAFKSAAERSPSSESRPMHRSASDPLFGYGGGPSASGIPARGTSRQSSLRHSAHIVASESEVDEIFATLLLDDAPEGNRSPPSGHRRLSS